MRGIYKVVFHSAIKKNKLMTFTGKQTELDMRIRNQISQTLKVKYHVFSPICEEYVHTYVYIRILKMQL